MARRWEEPEPEEFDPPEGAEAEAQEIADLEDREFRDGLGEEDASAEEEGDD